MTLKELAGEYRAGAAALKTRAAELRIRLKSERGSMQRLRLERRIDMLLSMYRDARDTAAKLEHYYDRGERRGRDAL